MSLTPELGPSSTKEKLVAPLAGFAKEVLASLRGKADQKLDGKQGKLDKIILNLEQLQHVFGNNTDAQAEKSDGALSSEQVKSFVDLVRTIFDFSPLREEEIPDLAKDLNVGEDGTPVLKMEGRAIRFVDMDFSRFKDKGDRLVKVALSSVGMGDSLGAKSCWDWIHAVYEKAGLKEGPAVYANSHYGNKGSLDYKAVLPGAWLYIHNGNKWDKNGDHSVIFSRWIDEKNRVAEVMSFPGAGSNKPCPRVHRVNFNQEEITRISLPV